LMVVFLTSCHAYTPVNSRKLVWQLEMSESRLVCVACIDIRVMQNSGFCDRCAAHTTVCSYQISHMQQHAVFCKILVLYGSNAYPVMLHVAWNPMLTHYPGGHGVRQIDFHVVHTSMVLNTSYATYILLLYATPNCVSKMVSNNRGCFVLIKSWRMLLPQSNMPI